MSFRFAKETLDKLKVLAEMEQRSQANYLEWKIGKLYDEAESESSDEFRRALKETSKK